MTDPNQQPNITINNNVTPPSGGNNLARDLFYVTATGILIASTVDVLQNGPENSVTGRLLHGAKDTTLINIKNNIPAQKNMIPVSELQRQLGLQHENDSLKMMNDPRVNPDTTALFRSSSPVPIEGYQAVDTTPKTKLDTLGVK